MSRLFLIIAAVSGLLAVALGAFGAHGLKSVLTAAELSTFKTAVFYQFVHTLALFAVALLMLSGQGLQQSKWLQMAGSGFILGGLLFCGSLYGLVFGGPKFLGPITPLGGLSFMVGWLSLFVAAWRMPSQ